MEKYDPQIFCSSPLLQSPFWHPPLPRTGTGMSHGVLFCPGLAYAGILLSPSVPTRWVSRLVRLSLCSTSSLFCSPGHGRLFLSENGTTLDCFLVFAVNITLLLTLAFFFSLFAIPQHLDRGFWSFRRHLGSIQQKLPRVVDT
ncbi:hypothetical protein CGRA01v4_13354 [Colletotrichum graminicola]|nr:hypothetical protein CGRA01v4_13354 [Colletotrichum graminicola]